MIRKLSSVTAAIFAVGMVQLGNANAQSANEINTSTMKIDFMGAVHLEETGIVVAGHNYSCFFKMHCAHEVYFHRAGVYFVRTLSVSVTELNHRYGKDRCCYGR